MTGTAISLDQGWIIFGNHIDTTFILITSQDEGSSAVSQVEIGI